MANIELDVLNRGWKLGFDTGGIRAIRTTLHGRYRRWRHCRKIVAELRQYSRNELAELGIGISDTGRIAYLAAER